MTKKEKKYHNFFKKLVKEYSKKYNLKVPKLIKDNRINFSGEYLNHSKKTPVIKYRTKGTAISYLLATILHEIGHHIFDSYNYSEFKDEFEAENFSFKILKKRFPKRIKEVAKDIENQLLSKDFSVIYSTYFLVYKKVWKNHINVSKLPKMKRRKR